MNLTKHEQLDLIRRIENMVSNIGDYLDGVDDAYYVNRQIDRIANALDVLKQSFYDENTYIKLRDRETGEFEYRYFEQGDIGALCYKASQFYAWADCDDTYEIVEIRCDGRELEYVGWQPCMLFEFVNEEGDVVYSAEFPQWDH
jgi:hypothetical protein